MNHVSGCVICGAPLVYFKEQRMLECSVCHRSFLSNASCENGHYVCDRCHSEDCLALAKEVCLESRSTDPVEILDGLMRLTGVHMHGPEHHVLIGSALLSAYRNAGGQIDLEPALKEMRRRGDMVPGGVCGMWGTCGAAVSCGIAYSIINGTSPLSEGSWSRGNALTSECLAAISRYGGPRCCKRDGFTALVAAVEFINREKGIGMIVPERITCTFHANNAQCLRGGCPYHG